MASEGMGMAPKDPGAWMDGLLTPDTPLELGEDPSDPFSLGLPDLPSLGPEGLGLDLDGDPFSGSLDFDDPYGRGTHAFAEGTGEHPSGPSPNLFAQPLGWASPPAVVPGGWPGAPAATTAAAAAAAPAAWPGIPVPGPESGPVPSSSPAQSFVGAGGAGAGARVAPLERSSSDDDKSSPAGTARAGLRDPRAVRAAGAAVLAGASKAASCGRDRNAERFPSPDRPSSGHPSSGASTQGSEQTGVGNRGGGGLGGGGAGGGGAAAAGGGAPSGDGEGSPLEEGESAERRAIRMARNRENAHLSRLRKKQHVALLEARCATLADQTRQLAALLARAGAENAILKQHLLAVCAMHGSPLPNLGASAPGPQRSVPPPGLAPGLAAPGSVPAPPGSDGVPAPLHPSLSPQAGAGVDRPARWAPPPAATGPALGAPPPPEATPVAAATAPPVRAGPSAAAPDTPNHSASAPPASLPGLPGAASPARRRRAPPYPVQSATRHSKRTRLGSVAAGILSVCALVALVGSGAGGGAGGLSSRLWASPAAPASSSTLSGGSALAALPAADFGARPGRARAGRSLASVDDRAGAAAAGRESPGSSALTAAAAPSPAESFVRELAPLALALPRDDECAASPDVGVSHALPRLAEAFLPRPRADGSEPARFETCRKMLELDAADVPAASLRSKKALERYLLGALGLRGRGGAPAGLGSLAHGAHGAGAPDARDDPSWARALATLDDDEGRAGRDDGAGEPPSGLSSALVPGQLDSYPGLERLNLPDPDGGRIDSPDRDGGPLEGAPLADNSVGAVPLGGPGAGSKAPAAPRLAARETSSLVDRACGDGFGEGHVVSAAWLPVGHGGPWGNGTELGPGTNGSQLIVIVLEPRRRIIAYACGVQ